MGEFSGKRAIVTGSSGIGLGAALKLAKEGATVILAGIDNGHNENARKAALGLDLTVQKTDVADDGQVAGLMETFGPEGIDILVNAAAIQTYGDIANTDPAHWDRVMSINLRSCYLTAHFAYPFMKARGGGSIIHVSSVQGHANQSNVLAYATTKGALHAMTRAMAVDCAKDNIRVNSISPGSIRTPLLEFAAEVVAGEGRDIEGTIAEFGRAHPLGRVGSVEETADLIAFLASDRAAFCTGSDYRIDGGLTAQIGV